MMLVKEVQKQCKNRFLMHKNIKNVNSPDKEKKNPGKILRRDTD